MSKERVIVYIDENTDDGMMWEELNQEGQMQVSVYDEEYEYDVEYHHSIIVKSLQEYLSDYTKQVRKEVCEEIKEKIMDQYIKGNTAWFNVEKLDKNVVWEILDQIQEDR
jgi:hypothetical protein